MKVLLLVLSLSFLSLPLFAQSGADIFKEYSCHGCHAVQKAGIAMDKSLAPKGEKPGVDLSTGVQDKGASVEWIANFLMKREKIKGERHNTRFKGSQKERMTLSEWLKEMRN